MYLKLNRLLHKYFSAQWRHKNELWLRAVYARYFMRSGACICPVCELKQKEFIPINAADTICPGCGSGQSRRRLFILLRQWWQNHENATSILDIAPPQGFAYFARKRFANAYHSFPEKRNASLNLNLINFDNEDYDVLLCYDVLDRVEKDESLMQTLFQHLNPDGICYIQCPFSMKVNPEKTSTAEEVKRHFNHTEIYRRYSLKGLSKKLRNVGFNTRGLHFKGKVDKETGKKYGFSENELILVAEKG